jgi:hypothetical protein
MTTKLDFTTNNKWDSVEKTIVDYLNLFKISYVTFGTVKCFNIMSTVSDPDYSMQIIIDELPNSTNSIKFADYPNDQTTIKISSDLKSLLQGF